MEEEKSTLTVTLKRDGVKKDEYKQIVFPMSDQEFNNKMQELSSIKSARYSIYKIESNLLINLSEQRNSHYFVKEHLSSCYRKRYFDFINQAVVYDFYDLNSMVQMLNDFSSLQEIQALIEIVTDDLEEIMKIIIDRKYHFYPYMSLLDMQVKHFILGCPKPYWYIDNENKYIDEENEWALGEYTDKGYFQTNTGVLLIQDKYLYYKARTKWENQKKEQDQEQ